MLKMTMKKQTEYTFDEAKEAAVRNVSALASFAESLYEHRFDQALHESVIELRTIEVKLKKASVPCLSDSEIQQVWNLGQEIIQYHPDLSFQLSQFWNLYDEVMKVLGSKPTGFGYALQGEIDSLRTRIDRVDKLAEKIVLSATAQISNILSPVALLLMHIIRTDTFESALKRQLKDAVEKHNLQGKYDVVAICSVESKVQKGQAWQTDVRAIRDAIAHSHFRIDVVENDWTIEFSNNTHGYNFHKRFSRKEFVRFLDLHTLLYKLQLHLLSVLELLVILVTHLRKQL